MGKPYAQELEKLSESYAWAAGTPICDLSKFVKLSAESPLYAVGSGGSFSAAVFASMLHQQIGSMAKPLTPLEFLGYENIGRNCSVLVVTAGGNNRDILSSFERAASIGPKNLAIVCASTDNKLTRLASKTKNIFVHSEDLPTKKDGFLATNSLVATMIWLFRSYVGSNSLPFVLPSLNDLAFGGHARQKFAKELSCRLEHLAGKKTILCLYDNWGKAAAVDAESKMSEAGLANVHLADYRSFAHGRHNWLDKNKEETGLVAFITPGCRSIAAKTLRLIPEYIPSASISTKFDGPVASLGLLIQSLFMIKIFGDARKIDPGRPGVPDFGTKIYHLSVPGSSSAPMTAFEELALRRKFGSATGSAAQSQMKSLKRFVDKVSKAKFGAAIFDYDGTLCDYDRRFSGPPMEVGDMLTSLLKNSISVGVATGRGSSVRKDLKKLISKNLWPQLFIGYYNCSEISNLEDESFPKTDSPCDPDLRLLANFLKEHDIISTKDKITMRPCQITIESETHDSMELADLIQKTGKAKRKNLRIVESGHSVDIISKGVSKLNLHKFLKERIPPMHEILCIGDRGMQPGNDFELLSAPFSLSVDAASLSEDTCWNLLPAGVIGAAGTIYYMDFFNIKKRHFEFDASKLRSHNEGSQC